MPNTNEPPGIFKDMSTNPLRDEVKEFYNRMTEDYTIGRQPCDKFDPQDGSYPGIMNEHDCPICRLTVSFCNNCHRDHHYKGWDICHKVRAAWDDEFEGDEKLFI